MTTHTCLSEIESAIYLKMTPDLLRYFSSYAPKYGETRKLQYVVKEGVRWYAKAELDAFDSYLKAPWPKKDGAQRPNLPQAIRQEIMLEASSACPVCSHDASGEAAHIEQVAKTLSHHPGNLIWLCPNHHTMVDNFAVIRNVTMEVAKVLKGLLVDRKLRVLHLERAASDGLLRIIRGVEELSSLLKNQAFAEASEGLLALAQEDVVAITEAADKVLADAVKPAREARSSAPITALASTLKQSAKNVRRAKLSTLVTFAADASEAREGFLAATGQTNCPLCLGRGIHNGLDCPVCDGEGAIDQHLSHRVDLADYEMMPCELCKGTQRHKGDDCPMCDGEGQYERRHSRRLDVREYDEVDCPACDGKGYRNGESCRSCDGERTMERRFANHIDRSDYQLVECPLCHKRGRDSDCPVCDGEFQLESWVAKQVDLSA